MKRNMTNTDDIVNLVAGFVEPKHKDELFSEMEQNTESEKIYNTVKAAWAFLASTNKMPEYKIENSYKKLQARLYPHDTTFRLKTNLFLNYAAILFLLLGVVSLMYYLDKQLNSKAGLRYTSVITKYKEMSQVVLPDSSIVWLNSGTTLTYNSDYSLNNRELYLKGEAFLDVRKNKNIPLIVSCNDIKVKVLGTRFNVSAYPEDHMITVVLESGKVELSNVKDKSFNYKLVPGEMVQYIEERNEISVKKISVTDYTVWKDGVMVFKDAPMTEVIKRLERKFDVDIIVENPAIYAPAFNATFKDEDLVNILDYIRYSCHIDYKLWKDDTNKTEIKLY